MVRDELFLKVTGTCSDFSNSLTLLLWEQFVQSECFPCPDPHRFPELAQSLNFVLGRYVGHPRVSVHLSGDFPMPTTGCQRSLLLSQLLSELEDHVDHFISKGLASETVDRVQVKEELQQFLSGAISPYLSEKLGCLHSHQAQMASDIPMYS